MTLNTLTPNLMVADIESTVEWYEDVFDADLVATLPAGQEEPWWAQVVVDGVTIMFQTDNSMIDEFPEMEGESGPGSTALYVDVDDIEGLYEDLEDEDVEIIQHLSRSGYGRSQFAVQDCNDYVLWFAEPITNEPTGPIVR